MIPATVPGIVSGPGRSQRGCRDPGPQWTGVTQGAAIRSRRWSADGHSAKWQRLPATGRAARWVCGSLGRISCCPRPIPLLARISRLPAIPGRRVDRPGRALRRTAWGRAQAGFPPVAGIRWRVFRHSAACGIASASCRPGKGGSRPSPGAPDGGNVREYGDVVAGPGPGPAACRQLAEIAGKTANATVAQGGSGPAADGGVVAAADRDAPYATAQAPATGCDRRRPGPFGSVLRHFPYRGEHIARLRQDRLLEPRSIGDPDVE